MHPVLVYLAANLSADRPSADRPREPLDDEIEQLSAQLERAKALKAATAAFQQQAAPSRRFVEPPASNESLYDKYAAPYNFFSSSYVPGGPLVASADHYTYADVHLFERAYFSGGARIIDGPRKPRFSMVATSSPSASIVDSVTALLPALAAFVSASQATHAALQVAAFSSSMPFSKAPPAATQSVPLPHFSEAPRG